MDDGPLRILIAEDDPAHAEAIRRSFQTAGLNAEVLLAGTLQAYREISTARPPDIALLDLNLPDGRAVEVLTSPAEAGPFPILIMTSYGNEQIAVEAMKAGALDYIVKSPEAFAGMPRLVERVLREWRLLQERKQADEALRGLLDRYRQLVENAREAIVVAQGGRLKFVNPMACEITGYSEEELVSLPFVDLVHPNDREMVVNLYLKRLKGDPLLDRYIFRILTKGGAIKWVEIGVALIEWEDQPATLNLLTDITARRQAEEALLESEAKIRSIFRAAPVGIGVESNRVILEANDTFCRMTGYSRDELIGQEARLLYPTTGDYDYVGQKKSRQISENESATLETRLRRKDGEIIHVLLNATPIDEKDLTKGVTFTALDVTERKRAEDALLKSGSMLKNILDTVPQAIFWKDNAGVYLGCNKMFADAVGMEDPDLIIGKTDFDLSWTREEAEAYRADDQEVIATGRAKSHIIETLQRADGKRLWVDTTKVQLIDESGKVFGILGAYDDISEHKRAVEALQNSESFLTSIIDQSPYPMWISDAQGTLIRLNQACRDLLNISEKDVVGKYNVLKDNIVEEQGFLPLIKRVFEEGERARFEIRYDSSQLKHLQLKHFASVILDVSVFPIRDASGRITNAVIQHMNITDRKRAEETLRASEERYRDLVENSQDLIYTHDLGGNLLSVNEAPVRLLGYSRESLLHMNLSDFLIPELRDELKTYLKEIQSQGQTSGIMRLQTATGGIRYWEFNNTLRTEGVDIPIVRGMAHDVTERRLAEKKLKESEEQYRTAIESSNDGVAIVEGEELRFVNQKYCEMYGYEKPEEVLGRSFTIVLHPDDREKLADYNRRRQRGEPVPSRYEYRGIRKDGEIIYIEASSTQMPFQGKSLSLAYLRDITDRKKAQARLEHTLENLRKAMGGIIQVISQTVETRDPYTAGHQQRVADLARAIGQEMGLDADRVDGLRMAGIIHDLGKISVPAEILSKPTQLREIEFQLIRTHPQVGYDILRDIEFPWPIAEIILQHHERIDGSGYPRGLEGEAILLEAKILMVADVVEAMASYRPYRPALGIEAALEEIEKQAGVLYDREVAAACLQLFREKGYKLECV